MIANAAFISIGGNYFRGVILNVMEFKERYVRSGELTSLRDLSEVKFEGVRYLWRNEKSQQVAKFVSSHLSSFGEAERLDDRKALREWARLEI